MKQRLVFVDGLRGIAACMVVLCHLVGRTSADWLTHRGYLGVAIFFVLSGYVITMTVGDRRITLSFLGRFAARRSIRLDPPYWASIALALLLAIAAAQIGVSKALPSASTLVAHLAYAQDLLQLEAISSIYWTLCYEIQFYLFLIVLLWITQRTSAFLPIWFAVLGISLLDNANLIDGLPGLFISHWYAFALGSMTYWVSSGKQPQWALVVAIGLTLVTAPLAHTDWSITAVVTAAALYAASRFGTMGTWLSGPISQFLGRTSYSLYLFHPLIGWTAQSVALKFVGQWTALAVGIAASVVSAWVAYAILERPSISLSRRIALQRAS